MPNVSGLGLALSSTSAPVSAECFAKNEGYDIFRFALIVYFGTPIALLGVISNAVLIRCFASRKRLESPTLYLLALAVFDFLICCIYLPFFTVDAIAIYFSRPLLYQLWHSYAMFLYGSSRVFQFASTYFVVCATFERFVVVANLKSLKALSTTRGRFLVVASTMAMVLLLRLPAFFDYQIEHNSHCPVFQSFTFVPLLMAYENYQLYNFYVICFLHILLPFLLLLLLNLSIIALTKKKVYRRMAPRRRYQRSNYTDMPQISMMLRKESLFSNHTHRSELRFATRTMVMITFTYLFCNIFNVIVTVMENAFKDNRLMFEEDGSSTRTLFSTKFYTYSADLVSIAVTINCFARIFVYFFCNPQFRCQMVSYAKGCLHRSRHRYGLRSATMNTTAGEVTRSKTDSTTSMTHDTVVEAEEYGRSSTRYRTKPHCLDSVPRKQADFSPDTTTSSPSPLAFVKNSAGVVISTTQTGGSSDGSEIDSCRAANYALTRLNASPTLPSLQLATSRLIGGKFSADARDDAGYETVNSSKSTLYI